MLDDGKIAGLGTHSWLLEHCIRLEMTWKIRFLSPSITIFSSEGSYISSTPLGQRKICGGYYNLKCFDLETNSARLYPGLNSITSIVEKDKDNMWIGTAAGLYLLNRNTGEETRRRHREIE